MSKRIYLKTANEVLDYGVDWADWLGSDQISSSAWEVPAGITLSASENDATSAKAWLAGGTVGGDYAVRNRIVTNAGRTAERSFRVRIVERRYN